MPPFYINLMLYDVIPPTKIISMINELQDDLLMLIKKENNVNIVEEMSELLYILIVYGNSMLKIVEEDWEEITNRVQFVSNIKNKSQPSISNKTIFKHMDILETINK